jgi:hypothetical protein
MDPHSGAVVMPTGGCSGSRSVVVLGVEVESASFERAADRAGVGWQVEALGEASVGHDHLARPALTYAFKTVLESRPTSVSEPFPMARPAA